VRAWRGAVDEAAPLYCELRRPLDWPTVAMGPLVRAAAPAANQNRCQRGLRYVVRLLRQLLAAIRDRLTFALMIATVLPAPCGSETQFSLLLIRPPYI
jgi:hypothetical protein